MNCTNIIEFENLIPVPIGLEYSLSNDKIKYSVAVNTDKLEVTTNIEQHQVEGIKKICTDKEIKGKVNLYETRVSGYLTYSVSVKCLKSSENFEVTALYTDKSGWISDSSILPIYSQGENNTKLPYMLTGYSANDPNPINVKVSLIQIIQEEIIVEPSTDVEFILVKGKFEIITN